MNKSFKYFLLILNIMLLTQTIGNAVDTKIKFDNQTYNLSNPETKTNKYIYLLKEENIGNWHSQLNFEKVSGTNPTEAAAEFAYKIQAENPGASVLVYPEASTIGYLTANKDYYEYNSVVFKKNNSGLEKLGYARRFYTTDNNGSEGARKSAISFAESNNKKYMEMINKLKINDK